MTMFDPEDDVSLAGTTGLDISWALDGTLKFAESIIVGETHSYSLEQLRPVALDQSSCVPAEQVQYWLYNGVLRRRDRERVLATGLRYGLTLLHANPIGRERGKTLGQIYNRLPGATLSYPAICEVQSGTAWFVFQITDEESRSAPFCAIVQANPGDKVIIPPNLYHAVINSGEAPLLFSTVLSLAAKSTYRSLANLRGAAWLNTIDNGWIKNPAYQDVAELSWWLPTPHPELGLTPNRPLYQNLIQLPESLLWLLEPMSFPDIFPDIWDGISALMKES